MDRDLTPGRILQSKHVLQVNQPSRIRIWNKFFKNIFLNRMIPCAWELKKGNSI